MIDKDKILNEIKSILSILEEQQPTDSFDACLKIENILALEELESCLLFQEGEGLETSLKEVLSQRWERVRGTGCSYTSRPHNLVNCLYHEVAQALSPLPQTEEAIDDLAPGEGPYFLLMPTLTGAKEHLWD